LNLPLPHQRVQWPGQERLPRPQSRWSAFNTVDGIIGIITMVLTIDNIVVQVRR